MANYTKVLVAIDGSDESEKIVSKAAAVAHAHSAELSAVLVFEPLASGYAYELDMNDFKEVQKEQQARIAVNVRKRLSIFGVPEQRVHFLAGKAATEIKKLVADSATDLLVIGSHGHNPIRAILGSTANAVLHGIHCDVLTVRV